MVLATGVLMMLMTAEVSTAAETEASEPAYEWVQTNIRVGSLSTVKVEMGSADKKPVKELVVRSRVDFPTVEGGVAALQVKVNGTMMTMDQVRNRLKRFYEGERLRSSCSFSDSWVIYYAPNFEPIPETSEFAADVDPYLLRFDVSDLWKADGGNTVDVINSPLAPSTVIADIGVSETLGPKMVSATAGPAPTGEIPTIVPITEAKVDYSYQQLPYGAIEVKLGDRTWVIQSQFSTNAPGWAALGEQKESKSQWETMKLSEDGLIAKAKDFRLLRTITRHDDRLQVVDRITNTSNDDLPVMFTHQTQVDRQDGTLYIGGRQVRLQKATFESGAHPAAVMMGKNVGLGLLSEDDITRVQGVIFAEQDRMGIRNQRLVVGRGKTVDLEFSIYPVDSGDNFTFINRVRRNWGVNFTLQGSEAMSSSYTPPGMYLEMTDQQLKAEMVNRSARYLIGVVWNFNFPELYDGLTPVNIEKVAMMDRAKEVCPDIERLVYYHCFIGHQDPRDFKDPKIAEVENRLFKKDKILKADGTEVNYSDPGMPLFLPTEGSVWAKAQESLLDFRLKQTRAEGIFWDEMARSAVRYDYNPDHWDGVSAEIDPDTHKITRKITSLTLASQPWRLKTAKKLMERGPLMGNGGPQTRTFTKLHFPRFVESGFINWLAECQLYTPIALGDHTSEVSELDTYHDMVEWLNYGVLYYYYRTDISITHPTLTSYMFPSTPINLGKGYIIAEERILTNTSGYFGWGDNSEFAAVVFDDRGHQTESINIPRIERDGKAYAEVRIPGGYSVAIVRK
jgi:hypothetical protein